MIVANIPETEKTKANESLSKNGKFKYIFVKTAHTKNSLKRNVQKFFDTMSRASSVASEVE